LGNAKSCPEIPIIFKVKKYIARCFLASRHISGFEIKNNGAGKSGENSQLGMSEKYATLE
jgi:hypothetical protein